MSLVRLIFLTSFLLTGALATAPQATAQPGSGGPYCCNDWWDPGGMHRRGMGWGPGHMGPGQQQRMMRHWVFMNQGVPPEYRGERNPLEWNEKNVAAGGALYAETCAACHGATGNGDGEAGRALTPSPALLSFMVRTPMAVDEYLFWAISDGGAPFGTDMPAFKDTLSDEEIWKIILYMRAGFPELGKEKQ